ncbi:hypothetical protein CLV72_11639 [Allonocardiopsis opalescens]|uniref:Uncharacterized protein n=2 Tax=Allonocardiopsis opalescens TaxID=1144618 RepID=A0A2T0PPM0_9ACTN|nr:hypothetical protein CLV72_11639 [Allonocardiopsis opalescens]
MKIVKFIALGAFAVWLTLLIAGIDWSARPCDEVDDEVWHAIDMAEAEGSLFSADVDLIDHYHREATSLIVDNPHCYPEDEVQYAQDMLARLQR